jgi:uncharacterized membrane protein
MFAGTAVAVYAHKQHGYLPSVLLVCHMIIEWYSHALHGNHYTTSEFIFHGTHAVLDLVFLSVEANEHYKEYTVVFVGVVIASIIVVFWWNYVPAPNTIPNNISPLVTQALKVQKTMRAVHSHGGGVLYHLVIGGILGCVVSHILAISRHKNIH